MDKYKFNEKNCKKKVKIFERKNDEKKELISSYADLKKT